MTILAWIFLSLFIISLGLYITFLILKKRLPSDTFGSLMLPFAGALSIMLLHNYLPDSYHTMVISAIALGIASLPLILRIFDKGEKFTPIALLINAGSFVTWTILYSSVFKIYRVPTWVNIIFLLIYLCGTVILFFFYRKQKIQNYVFSFLIIASGIVLHYCSVIRLFYDKKWGSAMLNSGATIALAYLVFFFLNRYRDNIKGRKLVRTILLTLSQLLIAFSNLLTFAG